MMISIVFPHTQAVVRKQMLFTTVVIVLLLLYVQCETDTNLLKSRIGLLGSLVGISFCAAPLSNLVSRINIRYTLLFSLNEVIIEWLCFKVYVIKTKDVESMPVPMIEMTAIVTFLWYLYGVCLGDTFIIVSYL